VGKKDKRNKVKDTGQSDQGSRNQNIKRLFQSTSLGVTFKIMKVTCKLLQPQTTTQNKQILRGAYRNKCHDCPKKYVGQRESIISVKLKEHTNSIKTAPVLTTPNIYWPQAKHIAQ
jgi:hypothetical protein